MVQRVKELLVHTNQLFPEQHDSVVLLLPHQTGRETIAASKVLVPHRCRPVPRVVVSDAGVAAFGATDNDVRAVHGV